ncbi:hypothetical protein Fmac_012768 [Flemingia macrophylla]|uniref:Uncharacterized protein n=1 Tax=Flemingia macrophylla TaxID=520843 RepID=A0ABD1MR79_9FABA
MEVLGRKRLLSKRRRPKFDAVERLGKIDESYRSEGTIDGHNFVIIREDRASVLINQPRVHRFVGPLKIKLLSEH